MNPYFMIMLLGLLWGNYLRAEDVPLDDFSKPLAWEVKEWGDPAGLKLVNHASGQKSLLLNFPAADKQLNHKGITLRRSLLGRARDYRQFRFDIFIGTTAAIDLAISFEADGHYELKSLRLEPGWHRNLQIPLLEHQFRSQEGDYERSLDPDLYIGTMVMAIHRHKNEAGQIILENFRSFYKPDLVLQEKKQVKVSPHKPSIKGIHFQELTPRVYQTMEFDLDIAATVIDPYDPQEFELKAVFFAPDGSRKEVAGFLAEGKVDLLQPVENAVWKLRWTPIQAGEWSYQFIVKNRWQQSMSPMFTLQVAKAEGHPGFVRVDREKPEFFSFESGEFFYPIGQNVAWLPIEDYPRYFKRMAESGQNWARIWMSHWSFGIEWKHMGEFRGLGNYNLEKAQKLDQLFAIAEEHDIYLQLVFDFHGAYSTKVNPEWLNNPHHVINGGFLTRAEDFFTDPQAKELYRKRLRYIIARWGHSPQLMAWEFFNEVTFTDHFDDAKVTDWHREMSRFVKKIDPYQHLTTTSFAGGYKAGSYALDTIDFTQYHIYANNFTSQLRYIHPQFRKFGKPFFIGEFGSHTDNGVDDQDRDGRFLHAGIWSQFMHNAGGNAMPWWWDSHIEPNDLYYHFKALSAFAHGIDRRRHQHVDIRQKLVMQLEDESYYFDLLGLRGDDLSLFWMVDTAGKHWADRAEPLAFDHVKVALTGWPQGRYTVEFWDTYRAQPISQQNVLVQDGTLRLHIPYFVNDIAWKIKRLEKQNQARL
ncbi:MAG: cellulase family glycosylhydrolase [Oligoflexus sp.]